MKNEGDVKKAVKDTFKQVSEQYPGKLWWFMPPANGYGRSGIPDFVGCFNGQLFAVETKFASGKLTAHQLNETAALTQANARVWIVRETSVDGFGLEFNAWVALCS